MAAWSVGWLVGWWVLGPLVLCAAPAPPILLPKAKAAHPWAGALSLASQAKYCGCIKYFPSCRKTKETLHELSVGGGCKWAEQTMRARDEPRVPFLFPSPFRGLCLRFILNYLCLVLGSRSSALGHRISRSLGWMALESRDLQNLPTTYSLAVRALCRIFIELHFAGEFMKNLKQLCGFGCIFPQAEWVAIDRLAGQLGGIPTRNCSWHSAMPKKGIPSMH